MSAPTQDETVEVRYQRLALERRLFGHAPCHRVGRYEIQTLLGRGGMGSVYAAYDPQLDRHVAIKVLRDYLRSSANASARLLREAKAIAQLSHPHVVEVFEAGEHRGQVFIAMALLQGVTLTEWLAQAHDVHRICDVLVQAGRGLAAAHAAGVIHRDFKPDNVIIDARGHATVVDFGLAGDVDSLVHSVPAALVVAEHCGSLTATGCLVGTPQYMAPEQYLGGELTQRSDQWSFCVVLFEALHGRRPYDAESLQALRDAVVDGDPRELLAGSNAPPYLVAIIARGLQRNPADRFASMEALLQALARGAGRTPRRGLMAGVTLVAVAGGGTLALAQRTEADRCHAAAAELSGVWDDARRDEVVATLSRSGQTAAADTATRTASILDTYAERWVALHTQSCERHGERDVDADLRLDRSMECLHRRRVALAAVVDVLVEGNPQALQSAVESSLALPSPEACTDQAALLQRVAPPEDPKLAAEVDATREALARAEALRVAGDDRQALAITTTLIDRVQGLGYAPLTAEVSLCHGRVLPDPTAAEGYLETAYFAASEARDWEAAGQAATELVVVVGAGLRRHEDGMVWVDHAQAALQRHGRATDAALLAAKAGVLHGQGELASAAATYQRALELDATDDPAGQLQRAGIHRDFADVLTDQAQYEAAMDHLRRAETLLAPLLGPHHPKIAIVIAVMGDTLRAAGDVQGAVEHHRRALNDVVDALGPDHRAVASNRSNLAQSLMRAGRYDEALVEATTARAGMERSYPADHPDLAKAHALVGMVQAQGGHYDEALQCFARARTIFEASLGPEHASVTDTLERVTMVHFAQRRFDRALPVMLEIAERQRRSFGDEHPMVARAESNLGILYMNLHDDKAAALHLVRALQIGEQALDPDHPSNAIAHANLAETLTNVGDYQGAVQHLDRAIAIQERVVGKDHRDVAFSLKARSVALSALQRHAQALADAERSVAIYTQIDAPPAERAAARLRLGETLWELGGERAYARAQVKQAREDYAQAGPSQADRVLAVDAWLAAHPR